MAQDCAGRAQFELLDSRRARSPSGLPRAASQEHAALESGIKAYGTNWRQVQRLIPSRTLVQIRTHAQKYFLKHGMPQGSNMPGASPSNGVLDGDGESMAVEFRRLSCDLRAISPCHVV